MRQLAGYCVDLDEVNVGLRQVKDVLLLLLYLGWSEGFNFRHILSLFNHHFVSIRCISLHSRRLGRSEASGGGARWRGFAKRASPGCTVGDRTAPNETLESTF
jgi:hypothetical protein